jgi:acyl-CoA synthetase (NDP forming)
MADAIEAHGLELCAFAGETVAELREHLPRFASFANPLDVTANAVMDPAALARVLALVAADPAVDMLALTFAGASGKAGVSIAKAVEALHEERDLPIAISWNAPRSQNGEAYDRLEALGVPIYATPARAIRGLAAIWTARGRAVSIPQDTPPPALPARLMNEADGKIRLLGTGIAAPAEVIAHDREAACAAAERIGFPVVAKLLSSRLDHKSDLGGVRASLMDGADVAEAFDAIAAIPDALSPPIPAEGVLIQEMVTGGVEVIVGARNDPAFGPVVMFGAGGIFAEIFEDVAVRVAPISDEEAREMIAETRIFRILTGARGGARLDIDALATAISSASRKVSETSGDVQELEINPLFVTERGVIAGDCVVRVCEQKSMT